MGQNPRLTPIQRLVAAMDRCAIARAEAQWTNGYRTGIARSNPREEARLHSKEMLQWKAVDKADAAFQRLAQTVLRTARPRKAAARPARKRKKER